MTVKPSADSLTVGGLGRRGWGEVVIASSREGK